MGDIEQKLRLLKTIDPQKIPKKQVMSFLQGDKGEKGEPGKDGKNGDSGKPGPQGVPGLKGLNGTDGFDGPPGSRGLTGERGIQGIPGKDGKEGEQGRRGHTGASGGTSTKLRITPSDGDIILSDRDQVILASGDISVTLPVGTDGKHFYIKNIGTGVITVIGTIDDDTNFELIRHEVIQVVFYGGWWII